MEFTRSGDDSKVERKFGGESRNGRWVNNQNGVPAALKSTLLDLWNAGCILAELLAGKPIMPGRTEVEQLHKIFKLCGSPSEEYWKKLKLPHATIFRPQQSYKRCIADTFKDFPASSLPRIIRESVKKYIVLASVETIVVD
ncbi:hypothetical protein POM88_006759 [Heracleum sosnowskyi]|uniref:Protein kinase domain-containing protein n=1 Tax=Heracleum sosnowskyi TaxID=360622 RepID=A0AAD8J632_9APIA|nr:hypothetical protein POM88_006759 [Heracleum sosnowskyi]